MIIIVKDNLNKPVCSRSDQKTGGQLTWNRIKIKPLVHHT